MSRQFTVDTILRDDIKVCQPVKGFRFSVDSILLSRFVKPKKVVNVLDIGSGSGVISAIISKIFYNSHKLHIDAVEIQDEMYACLLETINYSNIGNRVTGILADIKEFVPNCVYDLIISNPPYRNSSNGRICDTDVENNARFSEQLELEDIFKFAKKYLKSRGSLYLSYDADLCVELIHYGRIYDIEPKRIRYFHPDIDKPARIVLVELKKNSGTEVIIEPPIFQKVNGCKNIEYESMFYL